MTTQAVSELFERQTTAAPPLQPKRHRRFSCNGPQLVKWDLDSAIEEALRSGTTLNTTGGPLVATSITTPAHLVWTPGDFGNTTYGEFGSSTSTSPMPRATGDDPIHIFILYTIVFLLALVGNSLVIITLASNRRMRTVTNSFLLSLAVSDLLLALFCMPISLIGRMLKRFIFGSVLCKVFPYFMGISVSVSTFTMLAISIERYNAICNPLKSRGWQTKSHAYKVIAGIWLISLAFMSPFLVFSQLQYMPILKMGKCTLACRLFFQGPAERQAWYVIQIVLLFCIPGVLMTLAYVKVCFKIFEGFQFEAKKGKNTSSVRYSSVNGTETSHLSIPERSGKSNQSVRSCSSTDKEDNADKKDYLKVASPLLSRHNSKVGFSRESRINNSAAQLKAKKRVVKMLIVIVVLYFVCWTPLFIVNVWKAFDPAGARKSIEGGIEIIQLMSYISTCVNPVVYCFMHKKFREGFIRAFLCCLPKSCVSAVENKQPPSDRSGVTMSESMSRSSMMRSPRPSIRVNNYDA